MSIKEGKHNMAVLQDTSPALHQRTHDHHSRPLDITITALEASHCPWCRGLLRLLKQHLEEIAFRGLEVLN
jgi:hypothetical protein